MRAFRQVGEKQLPNPVLCMAWSPKRDLIALANTSGEVGLKSHFPYHETCLCVWVVFCFFFYHFVIVWLLFLFIVAAPPFGKFPACLELTTQRDDRVGDHGYCLET